MVRRTRRHTGGQNWVGFKYTANETRRAWVDALGPYSRSLLSVIKDIDWKGIRYEGPFEVETDAPSLKKSSSGFKIDEAEGEQRAIHKTTCLSEGPVTYEVFGGWCV